MQVDTERGTGRTTRAVVASLCAMLRGKRVIHVSSNGMAAKDHYVLAMHWLENNGWLLPESAAVMAVSADPVNRRITFGAGEITFNPMGACLRGMRCTITKDHYVLELEELERLKQERLDDAATIKTLMRKHGWNEVEDIKGKMEVGRRSDQNNLVFRT